MGVIRTILSLLEESAQNVKPKPGESLTFQQNNTAAIKHVPSVVRANSVMKTTENAQQLPV
jgi:hypothetical protein